VQAETPNAEVGVDRRKHKADTGIHLFHLLQEDQREGKQEEVVEENHLIDLISSYHTAKHYHNCL